MNVATSALALEPLGVVLVTGGSGFLGMSVLHELGRRPGVAQVLVAAHRRSPVTEPNSSHWTAIPMDLTGDVSVPNGVDTVIHVAGEKRDGNRLHAVNASGSQRLARAACASRVRRFVHVSTVGVYGAGSQGGQVTEGHSHRPANAYERSKDEGERAVSETCQGSDTSLVILRPSNVIQAVQDVPYPLLGLIRSVTGGLFTWFGPSARSWTNYVPVEDVAAAIVHVAECPNANDAYNVNCPALLEDAVRWITDELGLPVPRRRLPRWVGRLAGATGSAIRAATGRNVPFDVEKFRELTNGTCFDPRRLVEETGFHYAIGAERMFRQLARAYRAAGLA